MKLNGGFGGTTEVVWWRRCCLMGSQHLGSKYWGRRSVPIAPVNPADLRRIHAQMPPCCYEMEATTVDDKFGHGLTKNCWIGPSIFQRGDRPLMQRS